MRYKASRDGTMTLDAFLDEARAREVSEKQAKDIEPSESASSVLPLWYREYQSRIELK